jgi:hypothetical protein
MTGSYDPGRFRDGTHHLRFTIARAAHYNFCLSLLFRSSHSAWPLYFCPLSRILDIPLTHQLLVGFGSRMFHSLAELFHKQPMLSDLYLSRSERDLLTAALSTYLTIEAVQKLKADPNPSSNGRKLIIFRAVYGSALILSITELGRAVWRLMSLW